MHLASRRQLKHYQQTERRKIRSTLVNFVAALTVNAAIVLSIPRSTAVTPAPIVLRRKRKLIDGRWHEGEYVAGLRPSVILVDFDGLDDHADQGYPTSLISNN